MCLLWILSRTSVKVLLSAGQVEVGFKLEDQRGPAADWIALDPVQRSISKKFRNFLLGFQAEKDGPRYYLEAMLRMCRSAQLRVMILLHSYRGHGHFRLY